MISDEDKNRVRAATDLVALVQETVELRSRGHEFWGCCPFHGEKTPSFHIIPATQVWHCFGCGEGGDCFTYIMKRENLSFPESIRYLAERAGIELQEEASFTRRGTKRARLVEVCEATCDFYHTMLMRGKDGRGREYFASRGLGSDVCQRYRLGFAPGRGALVNHLRSQGFSPREMIDANVAIDRRGGLADRFYDRDMFPIFDEQGKCIAFGGRIMGAGEPKYLNTSETPLFHKKRNLYGFNWAKEHIVAANEAIVVEGYTDAIACWEGGIKNVVATLGTALTEHHVKTLTRFAKKIIYLFDGDNAGQKAAERAIQFVETGSIDLRCVILPDNMDPNDYVNANGGSALRQLLDESEPLLDFVFRKLEQRADASTPAGRARALEDACRLIYPLRASYMIDTYFVRIADLLGVDVDMVRTASKRVFNDVAREEEQAQQREAARERYQQNASRSTPRASREPVPAADFAPGIPSVDEEPYEPYDYLPAEAQGAVSAPFAESSVVPVAPAAAVPIYTDLERRSLAGERELLCLMTSHLDSFRPYGDRICEIDWVDPRHEAIAWAVLATPEGAGPAEVMDAARAVCEDAASLVSAGTIGVTSEHPTETNIVFLLDTLELNTLRRRMRTAQARLRSDSGMDAATRRELAIQATQDAARARELASAVEGVADPFRTLSEQLNQPSAAPNA